MYSIRYSRHKRSYQTGFTILEVCIVLVVVGVLAFAGWLVFNKTQNAPGKQSSAYNTGDGVNNGSANRAGATGGSANEVGGVQGVSEADKQIMWENTSEGGWLAMSGKTGGKPPACNEPLAIKSPADLTKATAVLYPGQERSGENLATKQGGNYKPHGGFRFDGLANSDVTVTSPINGYVYRGAQYLMEGEIQYSFDIIHPCGLMVRLGHLRVLSPAFQAIANKFPPAMEKDSRTERVTPYTAVKAGDVIATSVGLTAGKNVFFDLGTFDLRAQNQASKDPAYQAKHADAKELAYYATCWFDYLPKADASRVRGLPPGDPVHGKQSDYCK